MDNALQAAIADLTATRSPKRRSGAKRLRKLGRPEAGPALLASLEHELLDPRTWETQYQMVMALGECGYREALPILERLATTPIEATMVYTAVGDAIVRLSRAHDHDVTPVLRILRRPRNASLIDGAFRAMAMLRMIPDPESIGEILSFVRSLSPMDGLRFWVAAAAPGWKHPALDEFLTTCEDCTREDVVEAARLARAGKYKKWNPL